MNNCSIPECAKPIYRRNTCRMHYARIQRHGSPYVRLKNSVEKTVEQTLALHVPNRPISGCWIWLGHRDKRGYGRMYLNRRQGFAHRYIYQHFKGGLRDDQLLRHTCDNPPCVNPDHLIPGTDADNARDMVERGRSARGTKHRAAKLTESQVMEMRRTYAAGEASQADLARQYGLTPTPVSQLLRGITWKHLPLIERTERG